MRRRLFNLVCAASALLLGLLVVLWFRSRSAMDVVTIPAGRDTAWMITSHRGQWIELASFAGWPEPRLGWWSRPDYRDVGPFKFWQAHRTGGGYRISWRDGQMILPRQRTGGPIAYEGAYARATQLGYPGAIANGSLDWLMTRGWELKMPFAFPIAAAALLPLAWSTSRIVRHVRRRGRASGGCCPTCGYDICATPDRCPECGASFSRHGSG
jgi:hypothetical protein